MAARGAARDALRIALTSNPLPRRALAVALVMATVLIAFETTALLTALPTISDDLRGDRLYGATLSAYTLANMVGLVLSGAAVDRRGPRQPFLTCVVIFIAGLCISSIAHSMPVVLVGRVVQGLGGGGLAPISFVVISRVWTPDRQSRLFAAISAGWVLPSLVAPGLAGWVTHSFSWRWVFIGIIPLAAFVGVLGAVTMRRLPPSDVEHREPARIGSALALACGVGAFVAGIQASRPLSALVLVAVGILGTAYGYSRLMPSEAWRARRGLAAILACRTIAMAAFLGADSFIPLAADRIHGSSPTVQGFVIIGAALAWSLGSAIQSRRADLDVRRAVRLGFGLVIVGVLAVTPTLKETWPHAATFAAWAIAGLGMGLLFVPTSVAAMSYAEPGSEGRVGSQVNLADSLGFAVMGGVGGATVAVSDRTDWPLTHALFANFALAAGLAVVGALIAGRVTARSTTS